MPRGSKPRGILYISSAKLFGTSDGAAADINHRSAVLRFADARAGLNERFREALADGRDHRAVHALLHHLVLDRVGPPLGEALVVAERATGLGVAGHRKSHRSA